MSKKKIISLLLAVSVVVGGGIITFRHTSIASAKSNKEMVVMDYKPSAPVNQNGYQIDKLENVESNAWINKNEFLTLTKKNEFKNPDSTVNVLYCSIYNLNTKTTKDFKEVNICSFYGASPDGKYIMYEEPKYIPKVESKEWQAALDSGELLHHDIKLLDLASGQISSLKTEYKNKDAQYFWLNNDKILINYEEHWAIEDVNGKVIESGKYKKTGQFDYATISGFDIKDLGDKIEGKIYYTQDDLGSDGGRTSTALYSLDIKTKDSKLIYNGKNSLCAYKKGGTIIMDNHVDNGQISPGVYSRTFGAYSLDENGKILKDIKFDKYTESMTLSPDGSKLAYVEGHFPLDKLTKLKIMDLKTGETKEIIETKLIAHLQWDSTGKSLSFATGNSTWFSPRNDIKKIDTYIVNFDN